MSMRLKGDWRTNGLIPPPLKNDVEQLWAKDNKPSEPLQLSKFNELNILRILLFNVLVVFNI